MVGKHLSIDFLTPGINITVGHRPKSVHLHPVADHFNFRMVVCAGSLTIVVFILIMLFVVILIFVVILSSCSVTAIKIARNTCMVQFYQL